ncbi:MAG: TVP38/TMEM64 family protein [Nitratireductor sp.]
MIDEMEDSLEQLEKTNTPKGALIRAWAPVVAVLAILGFIWSMGWFDYFSLSSIIQHREALSSFVSENLVLGLLIFVCVYSGLVAISFPGASLLTVLSGFLFGGIVGGITTVFAATLGAVLIFLISRSSFGKTLENRAGGFIKKMSAGFQENAFEYLLTLRLTPLFPFWVMNIVPALLNMRLAPYAVATFLGIIPGTLAYAYIGSGLDSVIAAQEAASPGCAAAGTCEINLSALITKDIIIAMIGLAIVSILPVIVKKFKARKNKA